jgi:hypothetical protein
MAEIGYSGSYVRFVTEDKDVAMGFLGINNLVGDRYSIESKYENGERSDWMVNAWGETMGKVDRRVADRLDLAQAKGWTTVALLTFVAFTEGKEGEPGRYWGELAVISYDPKYEGAFSNFLEKLGEAYGDGIRPDLNIGKQGLQELVEKDGDYLPSGRKPLPTLEKGSAFVKTERSANEKLVNQARKKNLGCMIASWVFIFVVIALFVYGLHLAGLF